MVILAHVNPPNIIFQLRNFDVVLLIIVSSYLGYTTYKNNSYIKYAFKRFERLIIPTWIFLILFFILSFLLNIENYSFKTIIDTFILNEGIGYVWVIRIYFLISLLVPLCLVISGKKNKTCIYILTIIIYVIYELLNTIGIFENHIILYFFGYIIPCFVLIIVSLYLFSASKKSIFIFSILNFILFVLTGLYLYKKTGIIQLTNIHKYPFRIYYLSYALMLSSLIILFFKNEKICKYFNNRFVLFISKNSLWIYLWHILIVTIVNNNNVIWILKYLIVLIVSLLITYTQSLVISHLEKKCSSRLLKLFKG